MSYIRYLEEALRPFAAFADPERRVPESLQITQGSRMAKQQLFMRHCYLAADALSRRRPEPAAAPAESPSIERTVRDIIRPLAEIPLWRDLHPHGPDMFWPSKANSAMQAVGITPEHVRQARALFAKELS